MRGVFGVPSTVLDINRPIYHVNWSSTSIDHVNWCNSYHYRPLHPPTTVMITIFPRLKAPDQRNLTYTFELSQLEKPAGVMRNQKVLPLQLLFPLRNVYSCQQDVHTELKVARQLPRSRGRENASKCSRNPHIWKNPQGKSLEYSLAGWSKRECDQIFLFLSLHISHIVFLIDENTR